MRCFLYSLRVYQLSNYIYSLLYTAQKMEFFIRNFFSKCDQICQKLRIWSYLLKTSLMENFFFFCSLRFFDYYFQQVLIQKISVDISDMFFGGEKSFRVSLYVVKRLHRLLPKKILRQISIKVLNFPYLQTVLIDRMQIS